MVVVDSTILELISAVSNTGYIDRKKLEYNEYLNIKSLNSYVLRNLKTNNVDSSACPHYCTHSTVGRVEGKYTPSINHQMTNQLPSNNCHMAASDKYRFRSYKLGRAR